VAVAKLMEAERAKEEMEGELRRKEHELQKRTAARFRQAGGGGQDFIKMAVSHRGLGAFPRADMSWRLKTDETTTTTTTSQTPAQQVRCVTSRQGCI